MFSLNRFLNPGTTTSSLFGVPNLRKGVRYNSLLSDIHKYSRSKPKKFTIDRMIQSEKITEKNRSKICQEELKNRISHKIIEIENFPYGLSHIGSIKKVRNWYITSFQELQKFENTNLNQDTTNATNVDYIEEYNHVLKKIYERHSPTLMNISRGIFEWKKDLEDSYGEKIDFFNFGEKKYMLKSIEKSLNSFYDSRISIRLLIDHYLNLDKSDTDTTDDRIGIVSLKTQPLEILLEAWSNASFVSSRDFGNCPNLYVKGERLDEKLVEKYKHINFPYIDYHMYYILFEVLKNAIRATIEKEKETYELEDIHIDFSEAFNEYFTFKISDRGTGIHYKDLNNIWSYFYSTSDYILDSHTVDEINDFDNKAPVAGFGYGLPMSNLMVKYFDGNMTINSIEGKGTDVYIYI